LIEWIDQDRIDQLKKIYTAVEDIDLFVGGISERPNTKEAEAGFVLQIILCVIG